MCYNSFKLKIYWKNSMSISNNNIPYGFLENFDHSISTSPQGNINLCQDWDMYEDSKENDSIGVNPYAIHDGYFPDGQFPNVNPLFKNLTLCSIDQNIFNNRSYHHPIASYPEPNEIITKRHKIDELENPESNQQIVIVNDVFQEIFKWADETTAALLHLTSKFSYKNARMFINWINFNKKNPASLIDKESLKLFLKEQGVHIKYLDLSFYEEITSDDLIEIFNYSPEIQSLFLEFEKGNFTENVIKKLFSLNRLEDLTITTKDGFCLEKLCFKGLPNIRKLTLREAPCKLFNNLNKLSSLRHLNVNTNYLYGINFAELNLEKLQIGGELDSDASERFETSDKPDQISKLSALRSLKMSTEITLKDDFFEKFVNLEVLDLNICSDLQSFPSSIQSLTSLKKLVLDSCRPMDYSPIERLINLRMLKIHPLENKTSFLLAFKNLEKIEINFYSDLSFPNLYLLEKLKFVKIKSKAALEINVENKLDSFILAIKSICANLTVFDQTTSSIVFAINRFPIKPTFLNKLKNFKYKIENNGEKITLFK